MRHNLLLNVTSMFIVIAILSLLSSYFYNQYAADASARSSSLGLDKFGIQVCCSWGNEIANGVLTYRIDDDANPQVIQAVHQAVDEWNSKVPNIKLQEVTYRNADIDISTNSKAPKLTRAVSSVIGESKISAGKNIKLVAPGESQISFDSGGFIAHVDITISTKARGNPISSSQLESIAKHEIGHAYGIGHTNFIGDLMSPVLTGSTDISQCDISGVEEANSGPHSTKFLRC